MPRIVLFVRWVGLLSVVALISGAALVVLSVVAGRATVSLVVIVPVVSGSSGEFLLGVVLLIAGLFSLPWAFMDTATEASPPSASRGPPESSNGSGGGTGGLVLVGPVPIFFGSWRGVSRRTRWIVALVGAAVLALFVVGWLLAVR